MMQHGWVAMMLGLGTAVGTEQHLVLLASEPSHGRGGHEFNAGCLNALVWVSGLEVPAGGVDSKVSETKLAAHPDPKNK